MEAMANGIERALEQAVAMGPVDLDEALGPWWKLWIALAGFLVAYIYASLNSGS
jgi:alpha-1,3/alpha-1,6-mannosyltransferase